MNVGEVLKTLICGLVDKLHVHLTLHPTRKCLNGIKNKNLESS
jgi:hypothetical protein